MASKIILQELIEKERDNLDIPFDWQYHELKKFGLDWELFTYQQKAIENITSFLYLLFRNWQSKGGDEIKRNKQEIISLYRNTGLNQVLENNLAITEANGNYKFLSNFFPAGTRIPFETFVNRAAFWMATGSC